MTLCVPKRVSAQDDSTVRAILHVGTTTPTGTNGVIGGVLGMYGTTVPGFSFSDAVDNGDVPDGYAPMSLCAIERGGQRLVMERRRLLNGSTNTLNTFDLQTYQTDFLAGIPTKSFTIICTKVGVPVYVKIIDLYEPDSAEAFFPTGTGTFMFTFATDASDAPNTASRDPHRFRIVISTNASYSRVGFIQATGTTVPGGIKFNWNTMYVDDVASYEVQRLVARKFVPVLETGLEQKALLPLVVEREEKFRIKAKIKGGGVVYSDTITVDQAAPQVQPQPSGFGVYPTLITNNRTTLHFDGDLGRVSVTVTSCSNGQIVQTDMLNAIGSQPFDFKKLLPGYYVITVTSAQGVKTSKQVFVQ